MRTKKFLFSLTALLMLTVAAFGVLPAHIESAPQAQNINLCQQQSGNCVLEITEQGSPLDVSFGGDGGFSATETVFWGDRVLWTRNTSVDNNNVTWLEVYVGNGSLGWIPWVPGAFLEPNPFWTTLGFRPGTTVSVLPDGAGASLRESPSTYSDRVAQTTTGETLYIVDGPYQAEFHMWWLMENENGQQGWIIDIPGWIVPAGIG